MWNLVANKGLVTFMEMVLPNYNPQYVVTPLPTTEQIYLLAKTTSWRTRTSWSEKPIVLLSGGWTWLPSMFHKSKASLSFQSLFSFSILPSSFFLVPIPKVIMLKTLSAFFWVVPLHQVAFEALACSSVFFFLCTIFMIVETWY